MSIKFTLEIIISLLVFIFSHGNLLQACPLSALAPMHQELGTQSKVKNVEDLILIGKNLERMKAI